MRVNIGTNAFSGETAYARKTAFIEPESPLSGHRHAMPCRAVRGKTVTVKASMPGSGTSC